MFLEKIKQQIAIKNLILRNFGLESGIRITKQGINELEKKAT